MTIAEDGKTYGSLFDPSSLGLRESLSAKPELAV
jgi:hypothetical protein